MNGLVIRAIDLVLLVQSSIWALIDFFGFFNFFLSFSFLGFDILEKKGLSIFYIHFSAFWSLTLDFRRDVYRFIHFFFATSFST